MVGYLTLLFRILIWKTIWETSPPYIGFIYFIKSYVQIVDHKTISVLVTKMVYFILYFKKFPTIGTFDRSMNEWMNEWTNHIPLMIPFVIVNIALMIAYGHIPLLLISDFCFLFSVFGPVANHFTSRQSEKHIFYHGSRTQAVPSRLSSVNGSN